MIVPFGAPTVLLFGVEESPLAKAIVLIIGNLFGIIIIVFSFNYFGNNSFSWRIVVVIAITLVQLFRCLHPPVGAVAILGVFSNANLNFILSPVLIGFFILFVRAIIFNRIFKDKSTYPVHRI